MARDNAIFGTAFLAYVLSMVLPIEFVINQPKLINRICLLQILLDILLVSRTVAVTVSVLKLGQFSNFIFSRGKGDHVIPFFCSSFRFKTVFIFGLMAV